MMKIGGGGMDTKNRKQIKIDVNTARKTKDSPRVPWARSPFFMFKTFIS